jgi:hypothetical protein
MNSATILATITFAFSALFGVVGLHTHYRNPATGKVTPWGRVSLVGIILSASIGCLAAIVKDQSDEAERKIAKSQAETLRRIAESGSRETSRIATAVSGGSMLVLIRIPCTGRFHTYCTSLNEEIRSLNYDSRVGGVNTSTALMFSPDAARRFPVRYPVRISVYVRENSFPDCSMCNPGGIFRLGGETLAKDWKIIGHFPSWENTTITHIIAVAEIPTMDTHSFGQETPSLESFRGRIVTAFVSGQDMEMSIDGLKVITNNGQYISIGRKQLNTRKLSHGSVSEFRFPSDQDPRLFDVFIENG